MLSAQDIEAKVQMLYSQNILKARTKEKEAKLKMSRQKMGDLAMSEDIIDEHAELTVQEKRHMERIKKRDEEFQERQKKKDLTTEI